MSEKDTQFHEGDYVVATWGPMKFAPIQFHSFDVGPFLYRTRIAPDETPEEALNRAYAWCEKQGRAAFRRELDTFLECAALARSGARG